MLYQYVWAQTKDQSHVAPRKGGHPELDRLEYLDQDRILKCQSLIGAI